MRGRNKVRTGIVLVVLCAVGALGLGSEKEQDAVLRRLEDLPGGLIVQVGLEGEGLRPALRLNEHFLVQGLDTDKRTVEQVRAELLRRGLCGRFSAAWFDGERLPYADGIVNALILKKRFRLSDNEIRRALAPGGLLLEGGKRSIRTWVKPWPSDCDTWTHYLHDSSGNAVAHDTRVGPPRSVQWIEGPRHARSHEHTPTINAVVTAAGRLYYLVDEGPTASIKCPARWRLVCRDAFNGLLLWSRSFDPWFPHILNWGAFPARLQRRLVAEGDRIYVTLGYFAPVSCLDGASGAILRTYKGTEGADELVFHKGVLLVVIREPTKERRSKLADYLRLQRKSGSPLFVRERAQPFVAGLKAAENRAPRRLVAIDPESGKVLWEQAGKVTAGLRDLSLCAEGRRVFFYRRGETVCVDLKTGNVIWTQKSPPVFLAAQGRVYCASGSRLAALDCGSGRLVWSCEPWLCQIRDVFLIGDFLYVGGFRPYEGPRRRRRGPVWGPYFVVKREAETGRLLGRIEQRNPGHHHRCYRNKATDLYVLSGRRGVEFFDLKRGEVLWHNWVRGVCRYGVMPANGLLYAPPHACGCYITAKLDGFYALAHKRERKQESPEEPRMIKGPAYGKVDPLSGFSTGGWPTYRHDPQRSGATQASLGESFRRRWSVALGKSLTSPTVQAGLVCVAERESGTLSALNEATGEVVWRFVSASRIDSPPTFSKGTVIFGSRDGIVHCLRIRDGQVVWELEAAGSRSYFNVEGRLESVHPVSGSVLVWKNLAYILAGRSSYLDGGIDLYGVEPATGRVVFRRKIYSPDPRTGRQPSQYGPASMPGALEDILSAGSKYIYLRNSAFDREGRERNDPRPHLFALTGFLDASWPHRSYWIFGTEPSLSIGCAGRKRGLIYGRLLVVTKAAIYGYGRAGVHWSNQLQDGRYRLFALSRKERKLLWEIKPPFPVRALIFAGGRIFAAGPRGDLNCASPDPFAGTPGRLWVLKAQDGSLAGEYDLPASPVFDGMAACGSCLYISLENGSLLCMESS